MTITRSNVLMKGELLSERSKSAESISCLEIVLINWETEWPKHLHLCIETVDILYFSSVNTKTNGST